MQKKCITPNRFLQPVKVTILAPGTNEMQVPLSDLKDWLIVTHDEDDAVIATMRDSVMEEISVLSKRPLIPSTVFFIMEVNNSTIKLPRLPFINSLEISKRVDKNTYEAIAIDRYEVIGDEVIVEDRGVMQIQYEGGYAINELPQALLLAVYSEVAYRYDNRGDKKISEGLCEAANQYIQNFVVTSYL